MAGTKEGGLKAAAKNLANDPDFYKKIGQKGGSRSTPNSGFASFHTCHRMKGEHLVGQCAGKRGGRISRRRLAISDSGTAVADKHEVTNIGATA